MNALPLLPVLLLPNHCPVSIPDGCPVSQPSSHPRWRSRFAPDGCPVYSIVAFLDVPWLPVYSIVAFLDVPWLPSNVFCRVDVPWILWMSREFCGFCVDVPWLPSNVFCRVDVPWILWMSREFCGFCVDVPWIRRPRWRSRFAPDGCPVYSIPFTLSWLSWMSRGFRQMCFAVWMSRGFCGCPVNSVDSVWMSRGFAVDSVPWILRGFAGACSIACSTIPLSSPFVGA